jgi:hypothetical protein
MPRAIAEINAGTTINFASNSGNSPAPKANAANETTKIEITLTDLCKVELDNLIYPHEMCRIIWVANSLTVSILC